MLTYLELIIELIKCIDDFESRKSSQMDEAVELFESGRNLDATPVKLVSHQIRNYILQKLRNPELQLEEQSN